VDCLTAVTCRLAGCPACVDGPAPVVVTKTLPVPRGGGALAARFLTVVVRFMRLLLLVRANGFVMGGAIRQHFFLRGRPELEIVGEESTQEALCEW